MLGTARSGMQLQSSSAIVGAPARQSLGVQWPRSIRRTGALRAIGNAGDALHHEEGLLDQLVPGPPQMVGIAANHEATRNAELNQKAAKRAAERKREQLVYRTSAIAASTGISALAVFACALKFGQNMGPGEPFPWLDMAGTLVLTVGGAVGMEMWARWAHKALWHDFTPGWALHKSHHEPRLGPFEANDWFALINAVPAIALCAYGCLEPTLLGSLCFGAGLGITLFGMAYVFFHDGVVHKRFPVGPIANHPYMKRVVVAHRLHHSEKYGGTPWGMFLGPQELEALGAGPELDRLVAELELHPATSAASTGALESSNAKAPAASRR